MFGDTPRQAMSLGFLLFLSISLSISGTADGRRRKTIYVQDQGLCPNLQANTPDYLHFLTATSQGQNLAAFYNSGSNGQQSSGSQGSANQNKNKQQSGGSKVGSSEEITGFQPVQEQDIADKCINVAECDRSAKYRTINGTCNNFRFPMWGVTASALVRLLPAKYQDGDHKVRTSRSGKELPNVRKLSCTMFQDRNAPDGYNMYNVMQWGQLVAHDTTHAVQQDSNQEVNCCTPQCAAHRDICLAIQIPPNDPFYSKYYQTCLNMVRSATTTNLKCPLSPQQQLIAVTHFLDASPVYGSTDQIARSLRTNKDGLLRVRETNDKREFPPQSGSPKTECDNPGSDDICYGTGDDRANQNLGITVLQIILFREHNRLARELKKLNPHWDDERLYQEAKRIVSAEVQRITYDAFLPIILGKENVKALGLVDGDGDADFVNAYDELLNPSTVNSFATGAYRAFHSQIPEDVVLFNEDFKPMKTLKLADFYFRPPIIQKPGMFDRFLRGLALQSAQSQDKFFSVAITRYLFKSDKPYGRDLESLDMQRGRDHGLATYNDFRRACGLRPANQFGDLINFMHQDAVKYLQSYYESVEDIDLFMGGMMETRAPGALVGPTFVCIIGEQFKRWRNGDRFYYEFGNQAGSFTHDQLKEIRKITLAEIFCQNGDEIDKMTTDVFHAPSSQNPITSCANIVKMDLTPWKEK